MDYVTGKIAKIFDMGEGTRVEADFIDILGKDEGVLVGDTARGFFLVLAETRETETYPPRPFRVNVGSIHQYICTENGETKYLSELTAGDRILVTDGKKERYVTLGRAKIEKRDFVRIELENGITATLQKADSIYISGKNDALHLLDCTVGEEVTVAVGESIARHKGKAIDEEIKEK